MNKSVNTLRMLAMDEINNANSGHPGVVLGFAPIAFTLWHDYYKASPKNPDWFDRDRFVLASGHASSMLYALLHLFGYNVSMDDLKQFRHLGSKTPGHPEYRHTEGLDSTSGPLGQGIAMGAGMAIAETMLAARFNKEDIKIIDHYTYVECGDGDLQEGVTLEALSLIGHLKLNKLIILFDSNKVQLDGPVSNAGGISNAKKYFEALGFNYMEINDPEDTKEVARIIKHARKSDLPVMIECHTTIGYGSPLAGLSKSHGAPLGADNTAKLKEALGYTNEPFTVDEDVYLDCKHAAKDKTNLYNKWMRDLREYKEKYPEDYALLKKVIDDDYEATDKVFSGFEYTTEATRKTIGKIVGCLSKAMPTFVAGSADLTASTYVKGVDGDYTSENRLGRNINYGVREHAMGAIANGLTLSHIRNMTGAFFVFSDYMKPAIRMAAIMGIPSIFVFTHDSIAVGEDGPTHEPIEQLAGLRAIPNLNVLRPADSQSTVEAVKYAFSSKTTPTVICLTRQNLNYIGGESVTDYEKGTKVRKNGKAGTLIATGSEVNLALQAAEILKADGIDVQVVEITNPRTFETIKARHTYIDPSKPSMMIEMASPYGLKTYSDNVYAISTFGASGNVNDVIPYFGFTKEKVAEAFKKLL